MITPLMHILSSLDESYNVGHPINILYLNKSDRDLVIDEAKAIGSLLYDEDKIYIESSPTGLPMVSDVQIVVGEQYSFNRYTALLLTRVYNCFAKYQREVDVEETEAQDTDLSNDSIVMRLEGNPKYIYVVVYQLMDAPSLKYEEKIRQLQELLNVLEVHTTILTDVPKDATERARYTRLELQSKLAYWRKMLMGDYITYYGEVPPPFTMETIETIRKEITYLGLYGFVNPAAMYDEFTNSRVARKVMLNVDESVITFLRKVVKSGGGVA